MDKAFDTMIKKAVARAKLIKQCAKTPPGHDFQNPKVVMLMDEKVIEKTCVKCGLGKFYRCEE